MKKKKKSTQKARQQKDGLGNVDNSEASEELLALKAIYAEDLVTNKNGDGFSISIVPHPGDAAANYASIKLNVT
jgi:hypothetical protein